MMEISVDGYKDVSGPLGGLSVEYILNVNTSLETFKKNIENPSVCVTFTVSVLRS